MNIKLRDISLECNGYYKIVDNIIICEGENYIIKDNFNPRIDYLKIIDKILKENSYE